MSYSAVSHEFNVNASTIYFKQGVFKKYTYKNFMYRSTDKNLWPEAHRKLTLYNLRSSSSVFSNSESMALQNNIATVNNEN